MISYLIIRVNVPIDIRYVLDTKADLIDPTSLGSTTQYDILTYKGIIVAVIADEFDYNNGVYYLQGDNPRLYSSWIKLVSFPSETFDGDEIVLQWNGGLCCPAFQSTSFNIHQINNLYVLV